MSQILLYNTLTRAKEPLVPRVSGQVSLYVCGVTPYDKLHIGHARAFLTYDVLRRFLQSQGLEVRHIQNVTDVDDKIINRARELGLEPLTMAGDYHEKSLVELAALNILPAHEYPKVTGHIGPILSMVAKLVENGAGYARGGDVYYDVSRDEDYGKLSGQRVEELNAGARIEPGEIKDDAADFALWKGAKPHEPAWESPYGSGRPGWHIECSAMALELLGEGFDIHGGARELIFPHHENEIAQAESFLGKGKTYAKTWWHCGELRVNGLKMGKSLGNFITLEDAMTMAPKNVWRLLFLQTHPRAPLEYNEEKLTQIKSAWARLHNALGRIAAFNGEKSSDARDFKARFEAALCDDLNTPDALAAAFDGVSQFNRTGDLSLAVSVRDALQTIGFCFKTEDLTDQLTPQLLDLIISLRQSARDRRDFKTADVVRDKLKSLGVVLEDGPSGTTWKREI